MLSINPYFNFMGTSEEAMTFYKSVFGGEFTILQRYKDIPGSEKWPVEEQDKIIHISLVTPKGHVFMATDALESMDQKITAGNICRITIHTENETETKKLFNGLSAGGKIEMPLNKTFWGALCGMITDKYGIQWMLNYTYPTNK
ncbi:glyoxalase [Niastella yeongjuensis]|uniref:Glyoxalase n=1 Tax=Niastella yeongjuensis TaxID=354355 RepID=A0A1V9EMZ6_9BACT|nr:VOC family protein [Niastella yeongjuensis]OQP47506.1 glyoxalase [Niastella yeongjuensis]SEN87141.1 PhnB protein [Niastella yeongjuensis]